MVGLDKVDEALAGNPGPPLQRNGSGSASQSPATASSVDKPRGPAQLAVASGVRLLGEDDLRQSRAAPGKPVESTALRQHGFQLSARREVV